MSTRGQTGWFNTANKHLASLNASIAPDFTYASGTTTYLYVVPSDAATIYDTPNSTFNLNYTGTSNSGAAISVESSPTISTNYTGSGVTIGVGGESTISTTPIVNYRSKFLNDSTAPTVNTVTTEEDSSAVDEAYIDLELAGAMAPAATIYYYMDYDNLGIEQMVEDNVVDIFSLSYGECELDMTTTVNAQLSTWYKQAAAEGITVVVASGDNGSAGCDSTEDSDDSSVTEASSGLAVSGYASTPYNIAVGGTDYYSLEDNYTTYASTTNSSTTYYRTAISYIPESAWNDSTIDNTTFSKNEPWSAKSSSYSSYDNIVAGSGGKSSCATNSTSSTSTGKCTKGYSKPSWQTGTGVSSDSVRDIPDVSLLAGNGYNGASWLICTADTSGGITTNCGTQSDGYWYYTGYGGTSTSAPAFAGILALVVQKTGGRLGQAAEQLYDLYNGTHASTIFHDITVGNISVPCTSGSTDCKKNTAGYYYENGYDTATGYDMATGLGSVDATALLSYPLFGS